MLHGKRMHLSAFFASISSCSNNNQIWFLYKCSYIYLVTATLHTWRLFSQLITFVSYILIQFYIKKGLRLALRNYLKDSASICRKPWYLSTYFRKSTSCENLKLGLSASHPLSATPCQLNPSHPSAFLNCNSFHREVKWQ